MATSRSPGQRAGLDRARVLDAARRVLGEVGYAGLSMRAVARHLGVSPNALYSHVTDRTELVDAVLDGLLADIAAPPVDIADAVAGVHELMVATFDVLCAHPDLVPVYLARQGSRGPNAVALGQVMDALLARADVVDVPEARRALIVLTIGSAAFSPAPGSAEPALRAEQVRANFVAALTWMLRGITLPVEGTRPRARRAAARR